MHFHFREWVSMNLRKTLFTSFVLASFLTACGGGSNPPPEPVAAPTAMALAQICAAENPRIGDATAKTTLGTVADERNWVKAYMNERYLWYKDMPALDPNNARYNLSSNGLLNTVGSVSNYFLDSRTPLKTASGSAVDQFSFVTNTASWNNFAGSSDLGYGLMVKQSTASGARTLTVSYVYPTKPVSPAQRLDIRRGDLIISLDDVLVSDNTPSGIALLNEGLNPTQFASHKVVFSRAGTTFTRTLTPERVQLQQAEYKILDAPGTPGGKLGYLLFNQHVPDSEAKLVEAMSVFRAQAVRNLVVDLRYNGGGYLSIANALAASVAGSARAGGKIFEMTRFSDKRSAENFAMPFSLIGLGNQVYPSLNLAKIQVLVTGSTCSASESFINGLRGIDVEVELIGNTTCGKPYGFYPQDNCGLTYAAMEFEGVNAKGEGFYADGIGPQCAAQDDLGHPLGDPAEGMLSVAIKRLQGLTCNQASGLALAAASLVGMSVRDPSAVLRPDWQNNKVLPPYR
jgi:carboxyl-terminal processing protease